MSDSHALVFINKQDKKELSKEQEKFNKLTSDLNKLKKKLTEWEELIPKFNKECAATLKPAEETYKDLKLEFMRLLDNAFLTKKMSKKDKETISLFINEKLEELMDLEDTHNLKDIYNRHMRRNFDQDMEDGKNDLKDMVSNVFGIEFEEGQDFKNEEDFLNIFHEKMTETMASEQGPNKKFRKKSAKSLSKEKILAAKEKELSQSIKEIHRKLALKLHPDKELDPQEKERKTLLMQQINFAYKNKDLLKLLQFQLELEIVDGENMQQLNDDRIKTYNTILRDQIKSIRNEIKQIKMAFNFDMGINVVKPISILKHLKSLIRQVKLDTEEIQEDLIHCKNLKYLKTWLRQYREFRENEYMEYYIPYS